jgi:hypothetical protein
MATPEQAKQPESILRVPAPSNAPKILGETTPAQDAYIKRAGDLRAEFSDLMMKKQEAQTPADIALQAPLLDAVAKLDPKAAIDQKLSDAAKKSRETEGAKLDEAITENLLSQAREQRLTWLRTNGGEANESAELKDKRKALLADGKAFDDILPSTLSALSYMGGYDLVSLLMYYTGDKKDQRPTSDALAVGDKLVANLGKNKKVNATTGAADILPPTVSRVRINGKEGVLLTGNPELDRMTVPEEIYRQVLSRGVTRPGYYSLVAGSAWDYLPIYHGTSIEILEKRDLDQTTLDRYAAARRERGELVRMWDIMDNDGKPLSETPEDKELAEKAKKLHAEGKLGKPASPEGLRAVHNVGDLDFEGRKQALVDVFGKGAATDLMLAYEEKYGKPDARMQAAGQTGSSGIGIARMIALGFHEGGLVFGRQNDDPRSGFNIGTFQIGGVDSTPASSMAKYQKCLARGASMAGISASAAMDLPLGQRDLLAHFGYIESERHGSATFEKLFDPNLGYGETVTLMHKTIQGGIRAIGEHVWSLTQPSNKPMA